MLADRQFVDSKKAETLFSQFVGIGSFVQLCFKLSNFVSARVSRQAVCGQQEGVPRGQRQDLFAYL